MIGSDHEELDVTQDGRVVTIRLNRERKLNAVTEQQTDELYRLSREINNDRSVWAVVVTGAGPRSFCAGSDIGGLHDYDDDTWGFRNRPSYCLAIRAIRKPVVAAVNGYAFGGGLELALNSDIRIASTNASFAAPEVKLGWIGGAGMAALLSLSVGPSNASVMVMTGDPIDAERALSWGLVSEVVEPDALAGRAAELAATIAERPSIATQTAKLNLRAAYNMSLDQAIVYEGDLQTITFNTRDADEGRAAFAEKRAPNFEGR